MKSEPIRSRRSTRLIREDLMSAWSCLLCEERGLALNASSAFESHWSAVHGEAGDPE